MRVVATLKIVLIFVTAMNLGGCYEKHLTAPYVNPEQIWLVNNTGKKFDSIDIGTRNSVIYHTVPVGASVKIMLPIANEVLITEPGLCKEMIPKTSHNLTQEERERLNANCRPHFVFTKDDLYKAAEPLLAKEYITCLILYPDGSLEARTEHSTPWPSSSRKTHSPCSAPNAEQAVEFEPRRVLTKE